MYRTDKQFMKNPATSSARIYIGQLQKTVLASDLEAKFKIHGNILGLVLQAGFAFIQYENCNEAQSAIDKEHGSLMHGRRINVKQALEKNKPGGGGGGGMSGGNSFGGGNNSFGGGNNSFGGGQLPQNSKPLLSTPQQAPIPYKPQNQGGPSPMQFKSGPQQQQPKPLLGKSIGPPKDMNPMPKNDPVKPMIPIQDSDNQNKNDESNEMDHQSNVHGNNRPNQQNNQRFGNNNKGRGGGHFDHQRDNFNKNSNKGKQQFYGRDNFHAPPPAPFVPPLETVVDRNDCEIIVVAKALTEYAEYIEQQLKQIGLIVDLLFPNEDIPIGRVLANISSRGCLFAILVMPQNEEHRSLTLNILHGIPQEHRNIPIEDSLILISRNFEAYMRGEQITQEQAGQMTLQDKHPIPMQMLLNLLAENRQLTTVQYDKLISYLQERKELQQQHEIAEGIELDQDTGSAKKTELQNRIMNILNKSTDAEIPTSITAPEPAPAAAPQAAAPGAPPPLLKDPTVQKALDSLLLGDMFKNISGV